MKKQKSFKSYSIGVKILIIVFLVIAMVTSVLASMLYGGAYIFALVWEIPMFILIIKKLKNNEKISTALKVCTFIFFSIVSGIVLLTMDN